MSWNYYNDEIKKEEKPARIATWPKGKMLRQLNTLSSKVNSFLVDMNEAGVISEDDILEHTKVIDMLEQRIKGD
jgi:hypothetical protein